MLDAKCVHEAGHVIVLRCLFARNPTKVVIDKPNSRYDTHAGLPVPTTRDQIVRYSAFYLAGCEAVGHALGLGLLPPETDPNYGYSDPPGDENDANKLGLLSSYSFADGNEVAEANNLTKTCIENNWNDISTLAQAFAIDGTFLPADIDNLIGSP